MTKSDQRPKRLDPRQLESQRGFSHVEPGPAPAQRMPLRILFRPKLSVLILREVCAHPVEKPMEKYRWENTSPLSTERRVIITAAREENACVTPASADWRPAGPECVSHVVTVAPQVAETGVGSPWRPRA